MSSVGHLHLHLHQGWYMSDKSAFCAADAFEAEAMAVRGRKIRTRPAPSEAQKRPEESTQLPEAP